MRSKAKTIAFGGVLAALAVVIMCMGGLLPIATYACPMLCAILQYTVLRFCGKRIAWAWYGAVAILSLLLGPDKEAVAVFIFLGYYPILKPRIDKLPAKSLCKAVLFNTAILTMYWLLIHLMGMAHLAEEFSALGIAMTIVLLLLGNVTFFLLDMVLDKYGKMGRR